MPVPIVNVPTGICALKHLIQLAHSVRMITSKGARNLLKDVQFPGTLGHVSVYCFHGNGTCASR